MRQGSLKNFQELSFKCLALHMCFTGQLLQVNSVWTAGSDGFNSVYIAARTHVCSQHSLNKGHGVVTG